MPARVAVLGAGSWGTAMAAMLGRRIPTALWARRPELAVQMAATRVNPEYVTDVTLPPGVAPTGSLAEALDGADIVVMAVPSHGFRDVLHAAGPWLRRRVPVVSLTKGMEQGTNQRMTEVISEVAPGHPFAALTGPNLVEESVIGHPTASVVASSDAALAGESAVPPDSGA